MMSAEADNSEQQIADTIRSVADFKRRHNARREWLRTGACFSIGLLVVVVVDWYAAWQSPWSRWIGPLLALGISSRFCYRALKVQLGHPDDLAAARALDRSSSRSQERWSTVAALQPDGAGATGSAAMAKALIRETAPMCRFVNPAAIEPQPADKRSLAALAISGFLLLAFLGALLPQGSPRLLARFAFPWADLPLTRIDERTPLPSPLLTGSDAEVRAEISGKRPGEVVMEIADGRSDLDHPPAIRRLTSTTSAADEIPGSFTIERLRKPIRYRLLAGDASTPWRTVEVTDRPQLSAIEVTIVDPDYSTRPPRVWQKTPSEVQALRGSSIEVVLEMDRDIASATLEAALGDGDTQALPMQKIDARRYRFRSELNADLMFRPAFESTEGHANQSLPFSLINVVADQAPEVELSADSASEIVSISHDIEVAFEAHDDVGVTGAELIVTITDRNGRSRQETVPIDLGDQYGKNDVEIRKAISTSRLGLSADDEISYAVRVRDAYEQLADAGENGKGSAGSSASTQTDTQGLQPGSADNAQPTMTRRSLKIGSGDSAPGTSENRALRVADRELLNELSSRKKKILAVEAAFGQLKTYIASALNHTRTAKAPNYVRGEKRDMRPLYAAVGNARQDVASANQATENFAVQAPGTPYAFLSLQLQTVARSHLQPADAMLKGAVAGSLDELPPREPHRKMAEGHLVQAIAALEKLDSSVAQVRSQVDAEMAMSDLMTMHVAQVEDLPVLMEASGSGTPYQRSPAEVSKEQAEAALKLLESRKALYKKTAELLEQNPDLWQRYMDKSQAESEIFRDQLEALAHRHQRVQAMTLGIRAGETAAVARELGALIAGHHEKVATALQRTLGKARTWSPEKEPAWLKPLNAALLNAMRASGSETMSSDDLISASEQTLHDLTIASGLLRNTLRDSGNGSQRFSSLRLGELEMTISEQRLIYELSKTLKDQNWQHAALLEQTNVAHQTQQLVGKIEVESAGLLTLSGEIAGYGEALTETVQSALMPPLGESIEHLQSDKTNALFHTVAAQEKATEGYHATVRALDKFVVAAIKEKDKRSKGKASAGMAGLPKITANTLQELQDKLEAEREAGESFGIPCCRPTNFQIISDWDTFARQPKPGSSKPGQGNANPSSKPSSPPAELATAPESDPPPSKPGNGSDNDKQAPRPGDSPGSKPGDKRSRVDIASLTGSKPGTEPKTEATLTNNDDNQGGEPADGNRQNGKPEGSSPAGQAAASAVNDSSADTSGKAPELAQLARDQGLQQARSIAHSLMENSAHNAGSTGQRSSAQTDIDSNTNTPNGARSTPGDGGELVEGSSDGMGKSGLTTSSTFFRDGNRAGRDWNHIGSELRREFLQEQAIELPEHYRDAVEDYFRQLSKWQGRSPSTDAN